MPERRRPHDVEPRPNKPEGTDPEQIYESLLDTLDKQGRDLNLDYQSPLNVLIEDAPAMNLLANVLSHDTGLDLQEARQVIEDTASAPGMVYFSIYNRDHAGTRATIKDVFKEAARRIAEKRTTE